jgi:hypothetical protein
MSARIGKLHRSNFDIPQVEEFNKRVRVLCRDILSFAFYSERDDGVSEEQASIEMNPVLVNVVSPPHFGLPEDPTTPVIMFAGGTGKSTLSSPVF